LQSPFKGVYSKVEAVMIIRKKYFCSLKEADAFAQGFTFDSSWEVLDIDKEDRTLSDDDPLARWYVKLVKTEE
jgi:hypothetical protein